MECDEAVHGDAHAPHVIVRKDLVAVHGLKAVAIDVCAGLLYTGSVWVAHVGEAGQSCAWSHTYMRHIAWRTSDVREDQWIQCVPFPSLESETEVADLVAAGQH